MITPVLSPNPTLTEKFAWQLQHLYNAMGFEWRKRAIGHPLETAISWRMIGLWKRLKSVLEKWQAGTLRPVRVRKVRAGALSDDTPHPNPPPQGGRELPRTPGTDWWRLLSRRVGWLRRLLPDSAPHMGAFIWLLDDPRMQAAIADAPRQVGRALRPFCQFLGLPVPPALQLPKRLCVREKKPPLPPDPRAARFPDTPAARSAARALARELAGLPVDVRKLSAVAFGYYVHPPRDDNCPPPEIGYGGRRRPLPKDYKPPDRD